MTIHQSIVGYRTFPMNKSTKSEHSKAARKISRNDPPFPFQIATSHTLYNYIVQSYSFKYKGSFKLVQGQL